MDNTENVKVKPGEYAQALLAIDRELWPLNYDPTEIDCEWDVSNLANIADIVHRVLAGHPDYRTAGPEGYPFVDYPDGITSF